MARPKKDAISGLTTNCDGTATCILVNGRVKAVSLDEKIAQDYAYNLQKELNILLQDTGAVCIVATVKANLIRIPFQGTGRLDTNIPIG